MFREALAAILVLAAPLSWVACAAGTPANTDLVEEAKSVIASHEQYAAAGDLDGVMSNVHPEIVALTAGAPIVEGAAEFRDFYAGLLAMGAWNFTHHYERANVAGDLVELSGVARGTVTPEGGAAAQFENNFLLQLLRGEDGQLKVWRAAFAPLAPYAQVSTRS